MTKTSNSGGGGTVGVFSGVALGSVSAVASAFVAG